MIISPRPRVSSPVVGGAIFCVFKVKQKAVALERCALAPRIRLFCGREPVHKQQVGIATGLCILIVCRPVAHGFRLFYGLAGRRVRFGHSPPLRPRCLSPWPETGQQLFIFVFTFLVFVDSVRGGGRGRIGCRAMFFPSGVWRWSGYVDRDYT